MNNKYRLSLLVALSLTTSVLLQGCGSDSKTAKPTPLPPAEAFVQGTHPRFDPVNADLPFNTDLIFAKAAETDGTADVGAATDAVRAALNKMDGFSTSAYFDVMIDGSVNPASVLPMKTVFLIELNTGGKDALNPANIVGISGAASFDTQVVSLDGGTNNAIRIRPLSPLKSKAKYLVFLTNDIMDASGKPLTRSWSYNALRDTTYATLETLVPIRGAITGWEKLASGFLVAATGATASAALDKLILTYTFTTTDSQTPLIAMASPRAAIAGMQISAGVDAATAVGAALQLDAAGLLPTPKARPLSVSPLTGVDLGVLTQGALAGNVGKLYTGYIKLPYYLTTPTDLPFGAYVTRNWLPDTTLAGALKVTVPADADKTSLNVTYRYPFAAKTADETVPLQVTLPHPTWVPGYAASANCSQIYAATGYPVVIYVHGITSDRTSGVALMHTLASQCVATVAIDLPLHGVPANSPFVTVLNVEKSQLIPFAALYGADAPHERHFNVAANAKGAPAPMNFDAPTALDGSGAQFTNLGYLANTRDNNREGVIDLLNLNASLKGLNTGFLKDLGVSINLNRVYVVGISLGGIIGTTFTAVNQAAIANDKLVGIASNLNPIRGMVGASAGAQVSHIMINSPTFGPVVNAGLAASGVKAGTSSYEKFVYTAQSTLDSGDSVSFAQMLATQNVPVLIQQINNDQVIPNSVVGAPLTGTQALVRLLGANVLGLGETQLGLGYVKMTAGGHTSILRVENNAPQITAELQTQAASFIVNNGKVAVGAVAPANVQAP